MIYGIRLSGDSDFAAAYNAVDTYEEYGLALAADGFSISAPEARTEYKTVRGMDGALDVSEAPQGYPVFNNREIKLRLFRAVRPLRMIDIKEIMQLRTAFLARWQGRRVRITLPDDQTHYWVGRISVGPLEAGDGCGFFDCSAIVYPYKLKNAETTIEITNLTTSWKTYNLTNERRYVIPTITAGQATDVQMLQGISTVPPVVKLTLPDGETSAEFRDPDTLLIDGALQVRAKLASASASPYLAISYREGTL